MHPVGSHCTDTKRQLFPRIFKSIAEQENLRTTEAFVNLILSFRYIKGGAMSSVTYCVCRGLHVCFIVVGKQRRISEGKKKKDGEKSTVMLQRPI